MKLCEGEYSVYLVPFPGSLAAAVRLSEDGTYPSIYINIQLSPEARRRALSHELNHIDQDDFYNDLPIEAVETDDL